MEIIPNVHPMLVHFTVALITISFVTLMLGWLLSARGGNISHECFIVSRWCLWLGALAALATVGAGFHAYYTVAHDTPSHHVMTIHRNWALATLIVILCLVAWSLFLFFKQKKPSGLFTLGMLIIVGLVLLTGWYGGELVYRYGIGVISLPRGEEAGHQHSHDKPRKPLTNVHRQQRKHGQSGHSH